MNKIENGRSPKSQREPSKSHSHQQIDEPSPWVFPIERVGLESHEQRDPAPNQERYQIGAGDGAEGGWFHRAILLLAGNAGGDNIHGIGRGLIDDISRRVAASETRFVKE